MHSNLKSIFARRSIREYKNREVPDNMIKDILEAGMAAPSAVTKDPWHFIVVRNKNMLGQIANGLPNGQMLRKAGVGVVVCGDMNKAHDSQESYMIQDCSAAIENILLAASMLGLGACWLGVHPRRERINHIRGLFSLHDNIVPVSVISIGWPNSIPQARTRYNEAAVHYEKW
ncbi:MAG: nitroreductase family protein [Lentisphaerae bacterium]|nr:nitroreductase family protein [Lentisphaerota bacterium]